jgi:REP element-mobilizing transposase RayT
MYPMRVDPPLPKRKPQRLSPFDYSAPGAYFVTICVAQRRFLFGEIRDGAMHANALGALVEQTWRDLPSVVPTIDLDAFVLMPNHVHAVIAIRDGGGRDLGAIVRVFKSWSSRRVNAVRGDIGALWQRGYHEHVIRNDDDLDRIRHYIRENPHAWADDPENPRSGPHS